jgi:hypothetical protein
MALLPATQRQVPDHSIMDYYNKQTYLGNQYVVSTGLVTGEMSETPLLYLSNPATNYNQNAQSGNLGLFQVLRKLQCDTLEAGVIIRLYINPTAVTGGTNITPVNLRPSYGNNSKMIALKSPTTSSFGTFVALYTPNTAEVDSNILIVLDPGDSILITQEVGSASNVAAELVWYEL